MKTRILTYIGITWVLLCPNLASTQNNTIMPHRYISNGVSCAVNHIGAGIYITARHCTEYWTAPQYKIMHAPGNVDISFITGPLFPSNLIYARMSLYRSDDMLCLHTHARGLQCGLGLPPSPQGHVYLTWAHVLPGDSGTGVYDMWGNIVGIVWARLPTMDNMAVMAPITKGILDASYNTQR